ncbi:Erp family protein (plasmid) [Borreliella afzelii PKo]|uniref:Erp family protein n=1 Tax=Borreliella afzelii (strain PKo) TaxID=390236 RepID=G0ISV3_BORAP|nr:Erp family protein [Borreliella afzelii PKo]
MNGKMRMFIICVFFTLIISCKYYASSEDLKNLEQNVKGKVKGFLDTKERIVSDDPTVYEIAEKLKEEELKGKKENKEKKEDSNKNDLKDNEDVKALKPEPESIALEDKEPKVEIAEKILKPELPEMPKLPVAPLVVKPVVKEKTEEDKAKDREYEELKRKRIEQYQKQEEERLKRKEEREKRKKLREAESSGNFLEGITKGKISTVTKQIDKIISDIYSINPGSSFEERMVVSGKEVEDKVTGAIYDDITDNRSNGNSIYSEWSDDLEEGGLKKLLDELEKARTELRGKIKEGNENNEKNKNTVIISDIKGDLEKIKDKLKELKEYLQSNANKEEIQKLVKCSIDPNSDGCQE